MLAPRASAAPITVVDDGGADDETGQKDLSFLTVDYAPSVGDIAVTWGWDDTSWSGNNSGDACTLFDTDGDGFANFSLCITVKGAGVYQATRLYSCAADNRTDRCAGPAPDNTFTSTGSAEVVADSDPFGADPQSPNYDPNHFDTNDCDVNTACSTDDTVANLTVLLADVGAADAKLLNVCSYPSQEPNSDPSDCVVTPNSGFLTIVKVADPDDDATDFKFDLGAGQESQDGTSSWTIPGSGSVDLVSFAPGITYDLHEVIPTGWNLDSASCELKTAPPTSTGDANDPLTGVDNFTIQSGIETVCTFNDSKPATLHVVKVVVNNNGGIAEADDFSFSVNGGADTPFEADGQNDLTVDAGTYSVTEPAVSGYSTTYDNCTDVVIPNGGEATCTVTNDDIAEVNSQIAPTATTCAAFRDGKAAVLDTLNYSVKNNQISQVAPGVFFYWIQVTAADGLDTFTIEQKITSGNFSTYFGMASGSAVFNASCTKVGSALISQSGAFTTISFDGTTDATYFIGIKYDSGSVKGQTAPDPTTVHYTFETQGIAGSTEGLDLKKKV